MGPHRVGLQGSDSDRPILKTLHPHNAVAMLMDSVSNRSGVAFGDVLTIGMKIAAPLTLIVPFKAPVETGAEVETCR